MIVFSFPILWMNERKQVKIARLLYNARKQCVSINYGKPSEVQNFKLVYASGETKNEDKIIDHEFDIEVENSVKLVR